jgi:hypothetical protein
MNTFDERLQLLETLLSRLAERETYDSREHEREAITPLLYRGARGLFSSAGGKKLVGLPGPDIVSHIYEYGKFFGAQPRDLILVERIKEIFYGIPSKRVPSWRELLIAEGNGWEKAVDLRFGELKDILHTERISFLDFDGTACFLGNKEHQDVAHLLSIAKDGVFLAGTTWGSPGTTIPFKTVRSSGGRAHYGGTNTKPSYLLYLEDLVKKGIGFHATLWPNNTVFNGDDPDEKRGGPMLGILASKHFKDATCYNILGNRQVIEYDFVNQCWDEGTVGKGGLQYQDYLELHGIS